MDNTAERRFNGELEEDEEEEEANGGGLEAWERTYAEDRSWESLQEDESGMLRPIDNKAIYHAQYRRRLRALASTAGASRIQKGLIRYLYIIIDLSKVFYLLLNCCSCVNIVFYNWCMQLAFFKDGSMLLLSPIIKLGFNQMPWCFN